MRRFSTFFMGGYECADHINRSGDRVNLLKETQHDVRIDADYQALVDLGIRTVREGICWSDVETEPYKYDFSEVQNRMNSAKKYGVEQIWDLCHFGYPEGIWPGHPNFCKRFVSLCEAFALFYGAAGATKLQVIPINEISFLSWHSGDVRGTVPFTVNSGFDIKYHLCQAAIRGIRMIRQLLPDSVVMMVEPLIYVHRGEFTTDDALYHLNESQYQAMDIVLGKMCPELEGSEDLVDVLGFNYYWNCQWEDGGTTVYWPESDTEQMRIPLSVLLEMAYRRYKKPIFLSETGHFGDGRVAWIEEMTRECLIAMRNGVDMNGICIYPVTDRPDWDNLSSYCQCGIWDLNESGERYLDLPYASAIIACMSAVNGFIENPVVSQDALRMGPLSECLT